MTRILILGAAPLPFEPLKRQYAANLRTWHFTRPLLDDGHRVRLIACRLPKTYPEDAEPVTSTRRGALEYFSLSAELFHDRGYVQKLAEEFDPEAILGINTHMASRAVMIDTERPIWCDLNGWIMAEAQTKCRVYDDDRYLSHFWSMEREVLDRADVISTVSEAQAHATLGELAVRGRLGRKSFGYRFVHRVPNAVSEVEYRHDKTVIRGKISPSPPKRTIAGEGDFVVLWAGGYNTWTDVGLLYDALTAAMAEVPELRFVSTGGAIDGHDEITFDSFRRRAEHSRFADRFHFAGWVPTEDVPSYYFESDLGINVDSYNYETVFGARNRLNDMMKVGLPVLTTTGTEISSLLAEHDLGLTCAPGDAAAFAERMVWAARHRDRLKAKARAASTFMHREFSYRRTTEPVRAWAAEPYRAPDRGRRIVFGTVDIFSQDQAAPKPLWQPPDDVAGLPAVERGRVCAVIVHHRGREMLGRCLETLLDSTGVELEIVVVANACDEQLPEIVDVSARVSAVVSDTSLGFSAANNLGVEWAREHLGDHHCYYFVNNDTESSPGAVARLCAALEANEEAAMAGPTLLIQGAEGHYNSLGLNVTEDGWGWDEAIGLAIADYGPPPPSRPVLAVTGSALLIDASVFRDVGGWTEVYEYYFEDIDLGIKVWKAGREVIHVPDAVVRHQISATMTEGSERKNFLFWRNRLMLAVVHWPMGLLISTFRRAIFGELLDRRRRDHSVLRRALTETLARLPALLRCRQRWHGDDSWSRFLEPPGSVPVITLPALGGNAEQGETSGEELSGEELSGDGAEIVEEVGSAGEKTLPRDPERDADLPDPEAFASRPGARGAIEYLSETVAKTRDQLAAAEQRAEQAEARHDHVRHEMHMIHTSKMWQLWMAYLAVRKWLLSPFGFLRR